MWWSYWPTAWLFLAPMMMLACMAGMFFMMRGMHARNHPRSAWCDVDLARAGPHVSARFPGGQSPFEEYRAETLRRLDPQQEEFHDFLRRLRTAKDKAEFDQFRAEGRTRPGSQR